MLQDRFSSSNFASHPRFARRGTPLLRCSPLLLSGGGICPAPPRTLPLPHLDFLDSRIQNCLATPPPCSAHRLGLPTVVCVEGLCLRTSCGVRPLRRAGALAWRRGSVRVYARVLVPPNMYMHTYPLFYGIAMGDLLSLPPSIAWEL